MWPGETRRQQQQQKQHEQQAEQPEKYTLFIHDSNGQGINPRLLRPGTKVESHLRFTTTEAKESIPVVKNPNEVTDIVFKLGLNDFRHGLDAEQICNSTFEMQIAYYAAFPNARQHITGLPPLQNSHKEVTKRLQRLCQYMKCNFIHTKVFSDRKTGKIRRDTMRDYLHYNEYGIKILAKQIKKSLYSDANIKPTQLSSVYSTVMLSPLPTQ